MRSREKPFIVTLLVGGLDGVKVRPSPDKSPQVSFVTFYRVEDDGTRMPLDVNLSSLWTRYELISDDQMFHYQPILEGCLKVLVYATNGLAADNKVRDGQLKIGICYHTGGKAETYCVNRVPFEVEDHEGFRDTSYYEPAPRDDYSYY